MSKVSLNIVTHNGARYLPELFASLDKQTHRDFIVRIIDNASEDETMDITRQYPDFTVVRNSRNLGFSSAHNQGIRLAIDKWSGENLNDCYVVVANQDLILSSNAIATLVDVMSKNEKAGSAQGKILRAFVEHPEDDYLAETVCADIIDSTGIKATRGRIFSDRGSGSMDDGRYDMGGEIFGATGACAIYRASALESIRFENEFFDEDFFMYKEDVDLAWRLRLAGWNSIYVPLAIVYHHRGLAGSEKPGVIERIKNRRSKSKWFARLSTRNRMLAIWKNESLVNFILSFPWIFCVGMRQFLYSLIFEPVLLLKNLSCVSLLPRMLKKRKATFRNKSTSSKQIRRWFK
jgi:GT2 family glycosyltransferase